MRIKPDILIPNSIDNDLIDVLVEEYENFEILWYHWPKDGDGLKYKIVKEEDYEPVIIFYDDNEICMIYTRRHWAYQDYDKKTGLILPPQIAFFGEDHPPFVRKSEEDGEYKKKSESLVPRKYEVSSISKEDIEEKFRTGKGHGPFLASQFPKVKDPHDEAKKGYQEYLRKKARGEYNI